MPVLLESMERLGLDTRLGSPFTAVEKTDAGFKVLLKDGKELEAERVLAAMGRPPNVDSLNL